jgi:hypothetical protein
VDPVTDQQEKQELLKSGQTHAALADGLKRCRVLMDHYRTMIAKKSDEPETGDGELTAP